MNKTITGLKYLNYYGEMEIAHFPQNYLDWLVEQGWLIKVHDYLLISDHWIELSWQTQNEEDFIDHLFIFYPCYQDYLKIELLKYGVDIAKSEDKKGLLDFVDKLPDLGNDILQLHEKIQNNFNKSPEKLTNKEWEVIKQDNKSDIFQQINQLIFQGNIEYHRLMRILDDIQKISTNNSNTHFDLSPISKYDIDNNWKNNRRITSNPDLEPIEDTQYVLVPVKNRFSSLECDLEKYLNNPWGVFLIIFGMLENQMRAADNDRINLRPGKNLANPYEPESVDFFTYLDSGREAYISSFEDFIESFLKSRGLKLFPGESINLVPFFTEMLEDKIYIYENKEYILSDEVDSLLYKKPLLVLKNHCKQLKKDLTNYIERIASDYEN